MGGSATNSGIEFQQRVSAFFLLNMMLEKNIANILGIDDSNAYLINQIAYEGNYKIDDLVLKCENNYHLYFQIKTNVSLSEKTDSDFYKTISQFVRQFKEKKAINEKYFLIVSEKSSRTTTDLNEFFENIRLNESILQENSFTAKLLENISKFQNCCKKIFKKEKIDFESNFINFTKRVFINRMGILKGQPLEMLATQYIDTALKIDSDGFWNKLIVDSLEFGSKRRIIKKEEFIEKNINYFVENPVLLLDFDIFGKYSFEGELHRGSLEIKRKDEKMINFDLFVVNKFGGNNMGHIEEEAILKNNFAYFRTREASFTFEFLDGYVKVKSKNSHRMGGMSVNFDYVYSKINNANNEFIIVENTKEFLTNIGSNKKIYLKKGVYNLTKELFLENPYLAWLKEFDGYSVQINEVENLLIKADPGTEILVDPRYANVLSFIDCYNIELKNLIIGHTKQGSCVGGVVYLKNTSKVLLKNCILFGCGTSGLKTLNSKYISVENSTIEDCTYELLTLENTQNVTFRNFIFKNTKEFNLINILNCSSVDFSYGTIKNNYCSSSHHYLFSISDNSTPINLTNVNICYNDVNNFTNNRKKIVLDKSNKFENNKFNISEENIYEK